MHLSFHIISCLDLLLPLTKWKPLVEPRSRASEMGRPRSRDKALCHPALSLGSSTPSGVEMAQSSPGDRENICGSQMEVEKDWKRNGKKWAGDVSQVGVQGGECW